MTHTTQGLQELAAYYDAHSTADDMDGGEWVDEPVIEPMVTTSLRLPVEVMQAVRERATQEGVRPTALIRRWVEESVASAHGAAGPTLAAIHDELQAMRELMQAKAGGVGEATGATQPRTGSGNATAPTKSSRTTTKGAAATSRATKLPPTAKTAKAANSGK